MQPDVAALLDQLKHPRDREIRAIRELILAVDPGIQESVKWNAPSFYTSEHFATFHLRAKTGVQLVLHRGPKPRAAAGLRDAIPDPHGLLTWRGDDRAIVSFTDSDDVASKAAALQQIIRAWLEQL